jgi:hypothetical protein
MLLGAIAACGPDAGAPPAGAGAGAVVDSAVPRDEALRRFREGLAPVDTLAGPASRDSLVAAFVTAVATHDTAALGRLVLDRREFAYVFYPTSPQGLPPYDLSPQMMWDLLTRQSERGVGDLLRRIGGKRPELAGYDCGPEPVREGENLIWTSCRMTLAVPPADTVAARLTGPIIERGGRYKFISYTNELD